MRIPTSFFKYSGAFLLTPNLMEASKATSIEANNDGNLQEIIQKLKSDCNLDASLITQSEEAMAMFVERMHKFPSMAVKVRDVTGAGDTVLASLGFALASGNGIKEAVQFSNLAAGIVVGKEGSATASMKEIKELESNIGDQQWYSKNKIFEIGEDISSLQAHLKRCKKRVVFTNGCFDLLHGAHVKSLQQARGFGDFLILGLNSDASVSRLKGNSRPINKQEDRALILASLTMVDAVIIFDEDTPYNLISQLKPHVLVKGGDYIGKDVIGSNLVEEVKYTTPREGSTTQIIEKIRLSS